MVTLRIIFGLLSVFLYSIVSAATVPAVTVPSCGMQVTPVCADWHKDCANAISLAMTSKNSDYNLMHIPLPGNSALYQSSDNSLSVQVDDSFNFSGRATIKLKSSRKSGFDASVILYKEEDGKAHGFTYKLPAKTASDSEVRYCHHQLPKGYQAVHLQMVHGMEDSQH